MESMSSKKRVRVDSDESEYNSAEVKRFKEDLLDILDDSDMCSGGQDLASFMKSFEDEISAKTLETAVVDLSSESGDGESQPDLGYLFEASDDELGLPPSATSPFTESGVGTEVVRVVTESSELSELWRLDDQISSYDSFEFGFGYADGSNNGEYVALDGLFDHTDLGFDSSDFLWRPETLPAQ